MKYLLAILPLLCVLSLVSCEPKDELITTNPNAVLAFSGDTVLFDTVFVSRGSVTKRLKVFNQNKNAVRISGISLAGAAASPYQLTINGVQGPLVQDITLRGNDSLYILVQVTINPTDVTLPFLVADSILFKTNGQQQQVKLVAYGQNAYFHGKEALGTTTWPNDKPHVLLDTVLVKQGATLTILKGTQVYAGSKAALLVNGRLLVQGTPKERVRFSGYRREPEYTTAPGQWGGIRLQKTSAGNVLRYTDIRNAIDGLWISNPGMAGTLVEGCMVQYAFQHGIVCFSSDVKVVNTLIHNCGMYGFGGLEGGTYEVLYSTIVNYSPFIPYRQAPAFVVQGSEKAAIPASLRLINSIVYSEGTGFRDELHLAMAQRELDLQNNILRTEKYKEQLSQTTNILNLEPAFKSPLKADFSLDTLAAASGAAKVLPSINTDITGKTRHPTKPDIGAYERSID